MAENACRPVGHLEGAGPVRRCPSWCITAHDRDWVSHEGTAATFTFTDPSSCRQETILRAEIILIAECDEDMLRDPIVYVDGCGSPLELDQVGLDVYIEGLERHVQDMRELRNDYTRIISGPVPPEGGEPARRAVPPLSLVVQRMEGTTRGQTRFSPSSETARTGEPCSCGSKQQARSA